MSTLVLYSTLYLLASNRSNYTYALCCHTIIVTAVLLTYIQFGTHAIQQKTYQCVYLEYVKQIAKNAM